VLLFRGVTSQSHVNRRRDGSIVDLTTRGSSRRQVAGRGGTPNSSTGSGPRSHSERRLPPESGSGPQKPLRAAGRLLKMRARSPKGDGFGEESPRESRPACARVLPKAASAPVRVRLGRRAAAVVARVTPPCHRIRRGVQSKASGSGLVPQPGFAGSSPKEKPSRKRSPVSPQFGGRFPTPVRCLKCVSRVRSIIPPGRFWF